MPQLGALIKSSSIIYRGKGQNRREVLRELSDVSQDVYGFDANVVFEHALKRESLGGTGIGEGVAVPHARISGLDKTVGVFALLEKPVDFEAPDGQFADLVFLLLSPEEAGANHLKALAKVTRVMRDPEFRDSIRAARSAPAIMAILAGQEQKIENLA